MTMNNTSKKWNKSQYFSGSQSIFGEVSSSRFRESRIYGYLKSKKGFAGFGKGPKALMMNTMLKKIDKDYKNNPDIKWNFTKFVIDRQGEVIARFEPTEKMEDLEACVKKLI